MNMRIVILTSGSQLVGPVLERILAQSQVHVCGIVFDTEADRARPPLLQRIKSVIKYKGIWAVVSGLVRRVMWRRKPNANPATPVSSWRDMAAEHDIPIHVVDNIHEAGSLGFLRDLEPDLGLVIGTRLLKASIFKLPANGCINIHQGIIPDYRGGGTLFWPLFHGEKEIGVSVHKVVRKVDSGALYVQKRMPLVYDFSKYGLDYQAFKSNLAPELDRLAIEAIMEALDGIANGTLEPTPIDTTKGKRCRRPTHRDVKELRKVLRRRN